MSLFSQARIWSMLVVSVPIVVEDLRAGRIPKWSCGILLIAGLVTGAFEGGATGLFRALSGALAGLLVFLIFYLLGGMGAGDIKLMAACGSLVGLRGMATASILTAVVGAAIAAIVLAIGAMRHRRYQSIPYAPAIVTGVLLTLLSGTD